MIERYGRAFPVVERGANGRDWQFDSDVVLAFVADKEAERDQADSEREAAVQQLAFPFGHNGGTTLDGNEPAPLKPAELLMMAKVRKLQREEEYELGRLVRVSEIMPALQDALATLRVNFRAMAFRFAEERDWSETETNALLRAIDDCQVACVEHIRRTIGNKADSQPEVELGQGQAAAE
jgi:hypothetical protein